jgi:hypothetical protein
MDKNQTTKKKQKVWRAAHYLFDDNEKKQSFFEKIIPVLEPARQKHCPRRSKQEYAERVIQKIINAYWATILDEMILDGKVFYFNDRKTSLRIARLTFINNPLSFRMFPTPYNYTSYVSWQEGVITHTTVRFRLSDKYKKMLIHELNSGHEYSYGKPRYERTERPIVYR